MKYIFYLFLVVSLECASMQYQMIPQAPERKTTPPSHVIYTQPLVKNNTHEEKEDSCFWSLIRCLFPAQPYPISLTEPILDHRSSERN